MILHFFDTLRNKNRLNSKNRIAILDILQPNSKTRMHIKKLSVKRFRKKSFFSQSTSILGQYSK